jgi:DNA-binding XRE family transcriptional regulator
MQVAPNALTLAVLAALDELPGSERKLARAADVSHATLGAIRRGDFNATPKIAEKVASALEAWAATSQKNATRIRRAAMAAVTSSRKGGKAV